MLQYMLDSDLLYALFVNVPAKELSFRQILALAQPFEIAQTNIRSALSRMNARSTLETRKMGRNAVYSLCARGMKIGSNVSLHFRGLDWESWDGSYWSAAFSLPDPKDRYRVQKKLGAYRFRALYPGLWIRPFHPEEGIEEAFSEELGSGGLDLMRGVFARSLPKERIGTVFDLEAVGASLESASRTLGASIERASALPAREAFAEWLTTGDGLVKALVLDPLLPPSLLPDSWPASALRERFAEWNGVMYRLSMPFIEGALSA
jgi:phenylacetic acid degradation operon negative regulatory protein